MDKHVRIFGPMPSNLNRRRWERRSNVLARTFEKVSKADCRPTLLVKVVLGSDRDVCVSQCATGGIDAVRIIDPGTKFFPQSVQRFALETPFGLSQAKRDLNTLLQR
jgi:hypothetical protein